MRCVNLIKTIYKAKKNKKLLIKSLLIKIIINLLTQFSIYSKVYLLENWS